MSLSKSSMPFLRKIFFDPETSQLRPVWRGHLFLFDRPPAPTYTSAQGIKLLLIFLFLEVIFRPLLRVGARGLNVQEQPWWLLVQVSLLILVGLALVIYLARVPLAQLGLYAWRHWSKTEKLYFLQVIPLAVIVFSFVRASSLAKLWSRPNLGEIALFIFIPELLWGFYQEFAYRGLLQTELVRRWGTGWGILVSNLIFTFGPLHAYHFVEAQGNLSHLWIFAMIFAIGLLFAVLYKRSGNLLMIGIMHGIGDWFMDGLELVAKMRG